MSNDLINLLPTERQQRRSRDYLYRVIVVAIALFTGLIFVTAALLVPTFLLLEWSIDAKQAQLANLETALSSADEEELSLRLTTLSNNANILTALSNAPSVSAVVRGVLDIPSPGVSISGFTYTSASSLNNNAGKTLSISGISDTRDALRNYQLSLQEAPFARSAVLPVSAYAKDSDIVFTIIITLAL